MIFVEWTIWILQTQMYNFILLDREINFLESKCYNALLARTKKFVSNIDVADKTVLSKLQFIE